MKQATSSNEAGGPAKTSRETILERRKRVLGQKPPRSAEPISKSPASSDKRRSQVLQAQRAHRQRTIEYITDLENEIVRLRESEASLASAVEEKERQLETLSREVTTPTTNKGWIDTMDWDSEYWNSLLDPFNDYHWMGTDTLPTYDQSLFNLQSISGGNVYSSLR